MPQSFGDIKERVALGVRILAHQGVFPLALGHVSERVPGEDLVCILSGEVHDRGGTLDRIDAAGIVVIDFDGKLVEGELAPPGECFIHTEIYRSRPEVRSVVHAHPPMAVALSAAGQEVLPITAGSALFAPALATSRSSSLDRRRCPTRGVASNACSGSAVQRGCPLRVPWKATGLSDEESRLFL